MSTGEGLFEPTGVVRGDGRREYLMGSSKVPVYMYVSEHSEVCQDIRTLEAAVWYDGYQVGRANA